MQTHRSHWTLTSVLAATLTISTLCGCTGSSTVDYARPFPVEKQQLKSVDVQVSRSVTEISLINTTAYTLPAGTMWVNGQFAHPFEALPPGQSASYSLGQFRNQFNEAFRAGGFFASQQPSDLVLAQIETETDLIGLVVVNGRAER